jgi:hypothetical protein
MATGAGLPLPAANSVPIGTMTFEVTSMDIHIYEQHTGSFTGVAFGTRSMDVGSMAEFLNLYLLSGHSTFTGMGVDAQSQRIDVSSGKLICCKPSQSIAAQIAAIEAKQQRPLRELALEMLGARERLADLNRQIASLR